MFVVNYPLMLTERGLSEFAPLLEPTEVMGFSVNLNCEDPSSDSWTIMWSVRILTIVCWLALFYSQYNSTKQGRWEWCI